MNPPARSLLAAALLGAAVLAFGLSGCDQAEPASPPPAPAPSVDLPAGAVGSEGLTVSYLDGNGDIKTLNVEDFPR
jgi:hypothetical protein